MKQHPEGAPLCMDSQGLGGSTGKGNSGIEQHPEEALLCVDSQGAGGTGKGNRGPEQWALNANSR